MKRVFIDADTGKQIKEQTVITDAKDVATRVEVKNVIAGEEVGNKRTIAIVLWVVAIIFEVLALMAVMQSSPTPNVCSNRLTSRSTCVSDAAPNSTSFDNRSHSTGTHFRFR